MYERDVAIINPQSEILKYPILILAFNRPEKFEATLRCALSDGARKIYVSQDGPRLSYPNETLETGRIIEKYLSSGAIHGVKYHQSNLGTLNGIQSGISWFFTLEERGIILEDDLILFDGALHEADFALSIIDNSQQTASINLRNIVPLSHISEPEATFRYSKLNTSHGWGTTSFYWSKSIKSIKTRPNLSQLIRLCQFYGLIPGIFWFARFLNDYKLEVKTPDRANWDIRWSVSHAFNGWNSIYLNRNRLFYNGHGDDATHTKSTPTSFEVVYKVYDASPLLKPIKFAIDLKADAYLHKKGYRFTFFDGIKIIFSVRTRISKVLGYIRSHL